MSILRSNVTRLAVAAIAAALIALAVPAAGLAAGIHVSHPVSLHGGGSFHHGGGSFRGGFCYGCGWWGWGWGWYGYYPYGPYGYPGYAYRRGYLAGWTAVKTDVEPDEAALYLDGTLIGTADDFDGYPDRLYLRRGSYKLEFRLEGFEPLSVTVDASPGRSVRIDQHLKRIPGAKHHGTYNPERPAGGIVRYFAKKDGVAVPYVPETREYREPRDSRGYRTAPPDADRVEGPDTGSEEDAPAPEAPTEPVAAAPEDSAGIVAASESRILFHVEPDDAAVYVDDRFAGSARDLNALGAGLPVSPGEHRVTVTRPGYREKLLKINVGDREKPRLDISLSR